MKREVIFKADGTVASQSGCIDPGTSNYPWANTPSLALWQAWNDADNGSYAYCMGDSGQQHSVSFEPAPTLARFTKVTITAAFDYCNQGTNVYWFPPNNGYGPTCTLQIRARDGVTMLNGTGYSILEADPYFVNNNIDPGVFRLKQLVWTLSSHPEGGVFTREDLDGLVAGVSIAWSPGPNGLPYDTTGARWPKIRVPYLTVTLEVEDLGGYVDNMRHGASLTLRMMRRARNVVRPETFYHQAKGTIGSRVYLSHPKAPGGLRATLAEFLASLRGKPIAEGPGWGTRRLERRAGLVVKRKLKLQAFRAEDEVFDLRSYSCLGWAAYRIDGPWSPELQGLALLDKGRGLTHTRAQDAWSARPGDGALMRVLEGYPNLSSEGLAVAGGGDVAVCLRNYDLMQTGWSTVASAGDFGATTDATVTMVEELGYLSSCKLAYGAGGGAGGRERSLGTLPRAAGDFVHVRVVVKNSSVPTPASQFGEFYLSRSGGGLAAPEYWDESGRAWTTTPTYIAIPSSAPFGETILDAVPCDAPGATSDPTYVVGVGRFSSNMGPVTLHGAIVDVQHSDSTVAGARPPLVTLASTITRVADTHKMVHVWGRELWTHERVTAVVEARPWWRAADLPADAVKPLLHAQHASAGTGTWDALQFVPKTGSDDLIRFERAIDGETTYQLDAPLTGIDLTRAHVLRAWARVLGADGWREWGPYSVAVGWAVFLRSTGALVGSGSVLGRLTSEVAVPYDRDFLGIGWDGTRYADAWIRMWETRRNPLDERECVWLV